MKVQIEKNLYIEGDHKNIEVRQYTGKKNKTTGEDLFINYGYFSTVQQAAKKILKMKIAESTATTLRELVNDINRIESEIDKLIKG